MVANSARNRWLRKLNDIIAWQQFRQHFVWNTIFGKLRFILASCVNPCGFATIFMAIAVPIEPDTPWLYRIASFHADIAIFRFTQLHIQMNPFC